MDKKLLAIGLVMVAVGALLSVGSYQSTQAIFPNSNNTVTNKALLAPHLIAYSQLALNTTSYLSAGFNSSNTISFYIVNSTAFSELQPYFSANNSLINDATPLEGQGVFLIIYNESRGIYPYQPAYGTLFPVPTYQNSNTSILVNGTYYEILENDADSNTIVAYSTLVKPAVNVSIIASSSAGVGLIGSFLVLAGLVAIAYSFISRRPAQEQLRQEEIDGLYRRIEGGATGGKAAKGRGRRKGYKKVYRAKKNKR